MKSKEKIKLPYSIELLFQNKYLDSMSILCLLYAFKKSKKGIKVEEILFYYSIVISEHHVRTDDKSNKNSRYNITNLYLSFQKDIDKLIMVLFNNKYIEVYGDVETKFKDLKVKLTSEGINLIETTKEIYFIDLVKKFSNIKSEIKFTKSNEKKILGG